MAIIIKRVSIEDSRQKRISDRMKDGQLPVETYQGCGMFDLLHEPVDGTPCKPVEIGGRIWCMEDEHLFPVRAEKDRKDDGLQETPES